ncbi:Ca-activated chloride channel family protein [Dysgonomonas alginatilytica]|uniref:Ca-activated chloride channel family protein n=1 Tax=Dysgonomonas alginatilytica TaxID=1605892 RepID=A0A2V3PWE8_9BACT|nr:VWA domain-containing protein [Dysgonomonas alginatilytica]PXV68908.1 Ca-activated chloride channel family protein [Dysgonomonas alginatilytica]
MKTNTKILVALLLLCVSSIINAQSIKITGVITDPANDPIIGCTISEKGTNNQTMSDIDGNYSITVQANSTIVFSYIGYVSKEIKVKIPENINITLEEDSHMLSETVVIGFNYVKKKDVTSAMSTSSGRRQKAGKSKPSAPQKPSISISQSDMKSTLEYNKKNKNEEYGAYVENSFKSPLDEALSTLSIDVDAASYTNFRRYVNQGEFPPKDAIRVEEFINYFKYKNDEPTTKDPVKVTTEVGQCPWNEQHRLVRIGVKARETEKENLPPSNLVFLIDVSGSMAGATRLDLVKKSMNLLVNNLRNTDRVAIVVYASEVGEKLASTPGSEKQKIKEVIDGLVASGSTNGAGGIQKAYEIAEKNFIKGGNNRIILCTDGDFNVGVSSNEGLQELIEKKRKSGIFLSILGYGMGNYKDAKMQILAEKGNGNASYIDNMQEANRVLVQEFSGTLFAVAKDVKLQIEFNPAQVQAYRLIGYESRILNKEDFNDDTKDAGEMGVGQTVTALYEVIPVGVKTNKLPKVDKLKYQKAAKSNENIILTDSPELLTVKLRYKEPDKDNSVNMELPVLDNKKNDVSSDMHFASAVAMFAQLIKDSDYKGDATYDKVISLAKSGLENDQEGYKAEFIRLIEVTKNLK